MLGESLAKSGVTILGMPVGLTIKQLSEQYTLFKDVNLVYSSAVCVLCPL